MAGHGAKTNCCNLRVLCNFAGLLLFVFWVLVQFVPPDGFGQKATSGLLSPVTFSPVPKPTTAISFVVSTQLAVEGEESLPWNTGESGPEEDLMSEESPMPSFSTTTVLSQTIATKDLQKGTVAAPKKKSQLMVAVAAGLGQLEDVLVVFNSAVQHAADPTRLLFRVVTLAAEADDLIKGLKARLPSGLDLQAAAFDAWLPRVSRLLGGKSSERKELFDVLNFAAFYLHEVFPDAPRERVLYLDTDVVVLADLAGLLADRNLEGKPLAASGDCSQKIGKYIDFDKIKKKDVSTNIPMLQLGKKNSCVVNRGVVLVNSKQWRSRNITGIIEALVQAHLTKGIGPLWRSGVSQPPFLLAISSQYHNLGPDYNVRGLGRGDIGPEEISYYRKQHLWTPYMDGFVRKCKFVCCTGCKGWSWSPYLSANAYKAKILHFNGKNKPKKAGRRSSAPLKVPAKDLSDKEREDREQRPLCSCGASCVTECAGIWWKYMPPGGSS